MNQPEPSPRARRYVASLAFALLLATNACTYRVNSTADAPDADTSDGKCETAAGVCTLRAAVMQANAHWMTYSIEIPQGQYPLTLGGLQITRSVKIQGAGTQATIIYGYDIALPVHVQKPDPSEVLPGWCGRMCSETEVIINNLKLEGSNGDNGLGGVIKVEAIAELNNIIVRHGKAFTSGGGLFVASGGKVTIRRSSITNNYAKGAFGGGIANQGELWVYDSTIAYNDSNRAGGIFNDGNMYLHNTTVSGNFAHSMGVDATRGAGTGGIAQQGYAVLNNVTITNNEGVGNNQNSFRGGGIQTGVGKTTVLKNSIIAGNKSRRGTDGVGPKDCVGELSAHSRNNLIDDTTGCTISGGATFAMNEFTTNVDPQLGPLTSNGGPTQTHIPGTPSLNKGYPLLPGGPDPYACEGRDQRGVPRWPGSCDLGAVEVTSTNAFITEFILVNAATNTDIQPLRHGDTLILSELPSELSVRASVVGSPGSVVFHYDSIPSFKIENSAPYALGGDNSGNYNPVSFSEGRYTLSATPFAAPSAGGLPGGGHSITFVVRQGPLIGVWDWISGNVQR